MLSLKPARKSKKVLGMQNKPEMKFNGWRADLM